MGKRKEKFQVAVQKFPFSSKKELACTFKKNGVPPYQQITTEV
jgi:hypothetical protein